MAMKGKRGRKMSQAELGAAIGVSDSQIGFYEAETNEPGRDAWVAMASAMGVTPGWLAFGEEPREIEPARSRGRVTAGEHGT